ncbi:hypothetical protein AVEN_13919-1, partial [Araneus ventricosus]
MIFGSGVHLPARRDGGHFLDHQWQQDGKVLHLCHRPGYRVGLIPGFVVSAGNRSLASRMELGTRQSGSDKRFLPWRPEAARANQPKFGMAPKRSAKKKN